MPHPEGDQTLYHRQRRFLTRRLPLYLGGLGLTALGIYTVPPIIDALDNRLGTGTALRTGDSPDNQRTNASTKPKAQQQEHIVTIGHGPGEFPNASSAIEQLPAGTVQWDPSGDGVVGWGPVPRDNPPELVQPGDRFRVVSEGDTQENAAQPSSPEPTPYVGTHPTVIYTAPNGERFSCAQLKDGSPSDHSMALTNAYLQAGSENIAKGSNVVVYNAGNGPQTGIPQSAATEVCVRLNN